ncbi:MAG: hypothetical protein ABSB96_02390 [Gaiellaceae bacterium]
MEDLGAVLLVAAVAMFFLASTIWRHRLDRDGNGSGRILLPEEGHKTARPLRIEGELSPVAHGYHAWLAFEAESLLFPVEPELAASGGRFAAEIASEQIPEEPFSLTLLLVGAKGQRAIEYWLLQGGLGEGYPGFEGIPGASELDAVRNLLPEPNVGARQKSR